MRPYVATGMGRLTEHAQIDNYRDNWWCDAERRAYDSVPLSGDPLPPQPPPGFLSAETRAAASDEKRKLDALEIGPNYLCMQSVEWAKRSPAYPKLWLWPSKPRAMAVAMKRHCSVPNWLSIPCANSIRTATGPNRQSIIMETINY
jgi:hypothetical protein